MGNNPRLAGKVTLPAFLLANEGGDLPSVPCSGCEPPKRVGMSGRWPILAAGIVKDAQGDEILLRTAKGNPAQGEDALCSGHPQNMPTYSIESLTGQRLRLHG
jgi:hypothetical protein